MAPNPLPLVYRAHECKRKQLPLVMLHALALDVTALIDLSATGAIAASFLWCELMQPVDLVAALVSDRGFSEPEAAALLDASPSLQFSICYGARLDCRAVCEVRQLLHFRSVPMMLGCCCCNLAGSSGIGCLALCACGHIDMLMCQSQVLVVLDDGSQPLPLYVGRQAFPWNRDALASWDSGPLHPENGAWHSVSACFHGTIGRAAGLLPLACDVL